MATRVVSNIAWLLPYAVALSVMLAAVVAARVFGRRRGGMEALTAAGAFMMMHVFLGGGMRVIAFVVEASLSMQPDALLRMRVQAGLAVLSGLVLLLKAPAITRLVSRAVPVRTTDGLVLTEQHAPTVARALRFLGAFYLAYAALFILLPR